MTTTRKYYALYNSYGVQTTGEGEQAHIFDDKQSRDKWINACNQRAEERGAVTAEAITAKQAHQIIKDYERQYTHQNGKVYEYTNNGYLINEGAEYGCI